MGLASASRKASSDAADPLLKAGADGAAATTSQPAAKSPLLVSVIGLREIADVIGGIEAHCAVLYPALAAVDPSLSFRLITRSPYGEKRRRVTDNLTVAPLWAPSHGTLETLVHTPLAILAARWSGADIVHLHGIGPAFYSFFARLLGMRVLVTHHAADFRRPKWRFAGRTFLRAGEMLGARFAHRVICVSEALRTEFLARHPAAAGRTLVIRHGVSLPVPTAVAATELYDRLDLHEGRYFLAVGRLEETKRFDDLLAAHARSTTAFPLVIVGSTYSPSDYARRLQGAVRSDVRFVGFRQGDELAALYRGAALLIHPSAMEGFALVVLEAMTSGVPVAASNLAVHREFALPDNAYFEVGDVAQITEVMNRTLVRTAAAPPSTGTEGDSVARMVSQHRAVLHEVGDA